MRRILFIALALMLSSCAASLQTIPVQQVSQDEGRFNLIYLVGVKNDDIRKAVILDRQGDEYEFVPEVRDFDYEILQDISMHEALREADIFFKSFSYIRGATLSGIADHDGNIIGYEFKPYYDQKYYGVTDILNIGYHLKSDNRIETNIGIKFGLAPIADLPK